MLIDLSAKHRHNVKTIKTAGKNIKAVLTKKNNNTNTKYITRNDKYRKDSCDIFMIRKPQ